MKLCMFHPDDRPMDRGWVGRVEGERVVHLAAQTLQSFFLGGGGAREHAEYRLDGVTLLVPVLHPPSVRLFGSERAFAFGNPAAVVGPGAVVALPDREAGYSVRARVAVVIGAGQLIGGYSLLLEWELPGRPAPKSNDFGLVLGPFVATPDETSGAHQLVLSTEAGSTQGALSFDFADACRWAAAGTELRPGDVLASPSVCSLSGVTTGASVSVREPVLGELRARAA